MTRLPLRHSPIGRTIPPQPSEATRKLLKDLLEQDDGWHLRGGWNAWLGGARYETTSISTLSRDQRIAACAWLRQQRHSLYRAVVDDAAAQAPEGWIEAQPLYRALERRSNARPTDSL